MSRRAALGRAGGLSVRRLEEARSRIFTGKPSPNGGEMETVSFHVIRRFLYEIDLLRKGDVAGWQESGTFRKGLPEGNLASGTAIRIRPGR
ncbi:hypothetical protein ACFYP6_13895 [Streptomyces goshikiensis]|uniref:hypothetical protein n=1 Tax=Streptomyces goshikiensis TaxID=1942 RepID=UPI003673C5FE